MDRSSEDPMSIFMKDIFKEAFLLKFGSTPSHLTLNQEKTVLQIYQNCFRLGLSPSQSFSIKRKIKKNKIKNFGGKRIKKILKEKNSKKDLLGKTILRKFEQIFTPFENQKFTKEKIDSKAELNTFSIQPFTAGFSEVFCSANTFEEDILSEQRILTVPGRKVLLRERNSKSKWFRSYPRHQTVQNPTKKFLRAQFETVAPKGTNIRPAVYVMIKDLYNRESECELRFHGWPEEKARRLFFWHKNEKNKQKNYYFLLRRQMSLVKLKIQGEARKKMLKLENDSIEELQSINFIGRSKRTLKKCQYVR